MLMRRIGSCAKPYDKAAARLTVINCHAIFASEHIQDVSGTHARHILDVFKGFLTFELHCSLWLIRKV